MLNQSFSISNDDYFYYSKCESKFFIIFLNSCSTIYNFSLFNFFGFKFYYYFMFRTFLIFITSFSLIRSNKRAIFLIWFILYILVVYFDLTALQYFLQKTTGSCYFRSYFFPVFKLNFNVSSYIFFVLFKHLTIYYFFKVLIL